MGGEVTYGQTLHPTLCQLSEGHHALGPGGGKELKGQASVGVVGEVVLNHISHLAEHSPLLHVPCYPSSFPLCLGLLDVAVVAPASIPGVRI